MTMLRLLFLVFSAVMIPICYAQAFADIDKARAALVAGDYNEAQTLALSADSSAGFTLAAEALSAQVMLQKVPNVNRSARQAKRYAETALKLNPDNSEAIIQYALALGFETRSSGVMKAWMGKMPDKSKTAIDRALAVAPDDGRSLALRGAWHLGIVTKVGEENAQKWFGANVKNGLKGYDAALAKTPDDSVILGNYAFALLALDPIAYKDMATVLLDRLQDAPERAHIDRAVKARMSVFLPIIDDPDAIQDAVEALGGG